MKLVPTNLLTEIQAGVTTLATCIEIRRGDGQTFRLTNHDVALTVDGNVYDNTIPFNLAAIASGSNFGSDNTELTLFLDGTNFTLNDFNRGAFVSSSITIQLVNFLDTSDGRVVIREGWFGPIDTNTYGIAKITIYGMLKVLDIEIGRVYQPACDADFGDKRCKVALKQNQIYDTLTSYHVGDWVYYFDPALATAITVANPSFEADAGTVDDVSPISGWTRSADNGMEVLAVAGVTVPYSVDGTYLLYGGPTEAGRATDRHVYQEIDLVDDGINAAEIDDGQISIAFFANLAQTIYLYDCVRMRIEVRDAGGDVIDYFDEGYVPFEEFDTWYQRAHSGALLAGARYVRVYLYFHIKDGIAFNAAADNVRGYWWNHLSGSPYSEVIHKVARISAGDDPQYQKPAANGSFEGPTVSNSNVTAIEGWTRGSSADWWRVIGGLFLGLPSPDGTHMLVGGDDSSGTQKTYTITQTKDLVTDFSLSDTLIDLGKMVGKLNFSALFYDTVGSSRVIIDFLESDGTTVVNSITVMDYAPRAAPATESIEQAFVIAATTRKVRISLFARSDVGDSDANVGFDNFIWTFYNAEEPKKDDPISATGNDIAFSTVAGAYTIDEFLIWKAHTANILYDEVSSVTDRKQFVGTAISGGAGAFSTAVIRWISGANAGQRNLVRLWNPDTKAIKLYFPSINAIAVGDRFQYIRPCHKRFLEDCVATFDNGLNFRGFPHLPGKLT